MRAIRKRRVSPVSRVPSTGRENRAIAADADNTSTMITNDSSAQKHTDTDRDEPTDEPPELCCHDLPEESGRPLVAFYENAERAGEGQILYARATVNVGDFE